ncbi:substrate-binding periplasmic protein [Chitinimonas sp.]|uniref:substrate-binding periplasmic protein n=1 Tax=Chitinimonas sp. TaxID=1934313 RepID=UPI0035B18C42
MVLRLLLMLATLLPLARAESLIVFADESWPPLVQPSPNGMLGVIPAVMAAASKLSGDQYQLQYFPWRRAYEAALQGQGGIVGLSFNAERGDVFDYSAPFYDDNVEILSLKRHALVYRDLDDLRGKTIGGIIGASYGDRVDAAIAAGLFTVERDTSLRGRLRKLLAGRLDAAFVHGGLAAIEQVFASEPALTAHRQAFAVSPVPLLKDPLHLAFAKSMKQGAALQRFNLAIRQMTASGQLRAIIENEARRQAQSHRPSQN